MDKNETVIAFLGPKASYTHQAATQHFPPNNDQNTTTFSFSPQTTIEDVFSAVQSSQAGYGVVPFENSSNGAVVFTLDLFADPHARHPDILVDAEIYLPVHHCLLGFRDGPSSSGESTPRAAAAAAAHQPAAAATASTTGPAPPSLAHITTLHSHPQAWGQCQHFLAQHLKHAARVDATSTSRAAETVAQQGTTAGTTATAAIASKLAGELHGLEVLAESIEDNRAGNCTRFLVLRNRKLRQLRQQLQQQQGAVGDDDGDDGLGRFKSLVAFTVSRHGSAGALADSLAVFKRHGLNLTSINTRPSGEAQWHYYFFVEFGGRRRAEGEGGAVNLALGELGETTGKWRWLGSWEDAKGKLEGEMK